MIFYFFGFLKQVTAVYCRLVSKLKILPLQILSVGLPEMVITDNCKHHIANLNS